MRLSVDDEKMKTDLEYIKLSMRVKVFLDDVDITNTGVITADEEQGYIERHYDPVRFDGEGNVYYERLYGKVQIIDPEKRSSELCGND